VARDPAVVNDGDADDLPMTAVRRTRGEQVEMLYIDPEECIDCDACVEACPVDAITAEDQVPREWQRFIEINAAEHAVSPVASSR
jgi:NAD-dependent dihydropyrimidine dehydrogenase PreA subunit